MKSIAIVNTQLPTAGKRIEYLSGESLRDYDIVLFCPTFPYLSRIDFTGGGSCISVESSKALQTAIGHWSSELRTALEGGKTVFIVLDELENDRGASGSTYAKGQRTYHNFNIDNYQALPLRITVRNTKGKQIVVTDGAYKALYDAIKDIAQYRAILEPEQGKKIFSTKDGASVAAIATFDGLPGTVIFLPYFSLEEFDEEHDEWSKAALRISQQIANQLVVIDDALGREIQSTPPPAWIAETPKPEKALAFNTAIQSTEREIAALGRRKEEQIKARDKLLEYSRLLYENGKPLEDAIENSLKLLGYTAESYRSGPLEIDHIITSPEGFRMIGESEGRDNAAIGISKFRQLESNINEDLQRKEILTPAKGILFGNGFRLTSPKKREEQFTEKCLINAKRLGTALVRTTDLYRVVVRLLDAPEDGEFKKACRMALENTNGEIVNFP